MSKFRRRMWQSSVLAAGLFAIGLAAYLYFRKPAERHYRLTVTAGSVQGTRHELAELLRDELAASGLAFDVRESVGSEQALDWVNSGAIDAALVQGGLRVENRPHVRQVIALQIEPLHLLVRKELFEEVAKNLTALEGHTVDLGEEGSGTHTLATDVLEFSGLAIRGPDSPKGCIPKSLSTQQLMAAKQASDLPDAIFLVSPLPARVASHLVTHHGYRLVPLPFGEAFALKSLAKDRAAAGADGRQHIDKRRTFSTTIPAFTYSVDPPVPAANLPSLGNRLLLVANARVSPDAVARMVEGILASEFSKTVQPPLTAKQLEQAPEFPWHAGTQKVIERNQPIVSGEVMEHAQKAAAIAGAVISGVVVLWRWYTERSRIRRSREFRGYLSQVSEIESEALAIERQPSESAAVLPKLHERLYQLKREALERFSEGELEGGEFMTTFLGQADHVSDLLTRLIQYRK